MLEPGAKTLEQQSNTVWAQRLKLLCLLLLKGQLINEMEILLSELSGQRICPVLGKKRKKRKNYIVRRHNEPLDLEAAQGCCLKTTAQMGGDLIK